MNWAIRLVTSSVGMKVLMAATGAGLLGFVVVHMVGNLLVFAGPEALNEYAHGLKSLGLLLWVARLGVLAMITVHVAVAFRLYTANNTARPTKYVMARPPETTISSQSMIISGGLLATFVLFHLAHYTLGVVEPSTYAATESNLYLLDGEKVPNVFYMVVRGFQNPVMMGLYVVSMGLLGMHLSHGIASLFQSLGFNNPRFRPLVKKASWALTGLLVAGNISMPLAVFFGFIDVTSTGA